MEVDENFAQEFQGLSYDNEKFNEKCRKLSEDIIKGQLTVLQLVEKLAGLLMNSLVTERELGVWILTNILESLPPNHLNEVELKHISIFYSSKFKDSHQLTHPLLRGVLAIVQYEQFPGGAVEEVLDSLFQNVVCQQQQKDDRLLFYKILLKSSEKYQSEILSMKMNYVYGVISTIEGERDPKNLLFIFNWLASFLPVLHLGHLCEEMFEILACYFPVDFRAPLKDPNAITREVLASSLEACLCAHPEFAEYCIPLALEKLDSSLDIAKRDSLLLIASGCKKFSTYYYYMHIKDIYRLIEKEIFNNCPPELDKTCQYSLASVIKKLSEVEEEFCDVLKDICVSLKRNLLPVEAVMYEKCSKILLSVSSATRTSAKFIVEEICPILTNTFNITTSVKSKILILDVTIKLANIYIEKHHSIDNEALSAVPYNCIKASSDHSVDLKKMGFSGIATLFKFLPLDVRLEIYQNLVHQLLTSTNQQFLFTCLIKLARAYNKEIKEHVLDKIDQEKNPDLYLEVICTLALQEYFHDHVVNVINTYLTKGKVGEVCSSLKLLLNENCDNKIHMALFKVNMVYKIIEFNKIDRAFLGNVSETLRALVGVQTSDVQKTIVDEVLPILSKPEKDNATCIHMMFGILCRLQRDVQLDYCLLDQLTNFIQTSNDEGLQEVAGQLLANLVNKCVDDNVLNIFLDKLELEIGTDFRILAWVTKALVMRNHVRSNSWTYRLINLLKINQEIAICFKIILSDEYEALSVNSHCVRTLLFKQKFFTIASKQLVQNFRPEFKSFLLALGYLIEFAPQQVVLMEFKKLIKLTIYCLEDYTNSQVLKVLLPIFNEMISTSQIDIEDNLDEFLTRILNLCCFHQSMHIRILALQCMQKFPQNFAIFKLLKHKQTVIKAFRKCIDDRKRLVRKEAVEAMSLWILLDAPL